MTPLDSLLGTEGQPKCKVYSSEISVHWFATDAVPGDPCLCGTQVMSPPDDQGDESNA